ncbi:3'-5' exonuclease, partial [Vibrio agarivorans]
CETDVLNTWLVFLRFQLMRGEIDAAGYAQELTLLREYLQQEGHAHFLTFLEHWAPDAET